MGFLLKIVEGPNKGAEIALVSGVAVTLGKGEDCDIILADQTLPQSPIRLEASDIGVTADGEPLERFSVKTVGATAFAIGPDDAPWDPLVWEEVESRKTKDESPEAESASEQTDERSNESTDKRTNESTDERTNGKTDERTNEQTNKRKSGCLIVAIVLLLILIAICWLFRAQISAHTRSLREKAVTKWRVRSGGTTAVAEADIPVPASLALEIVAARYGLELEERDGRAKLSGNFATRADRLRATAEAYDTRPGVELDLSDDEPFKTAADDALFTLTEGALKVASATNRYLHIVGASASPLTLQKTMEQLSDDLPKLRGFDVSGVRLASIAIPMPPAAAGPASRQPNPRTSKPQVSLPVCGILTKPYPCLVLRDGSRVLEGAPLGESVVLKIEADEVTITNSAGRLTWKP